jgi:antitoxin VapB
MIDLSQETETLAKRLAALRHLSVEAAIKQALEESVRAASVASDTLTHKDCSPEAIAARRERLDRLVAQVAALPVLDPRSSEEIADDLNAL